MNTLILLLFAAADPTGLQAAFESAETVDLSYGWTGVKVTLINPETIKKLTPLVDVKGEAVKSNAIPGTTDIIRVDIRGKKTTKFWVIRSKIGFDGQLIDPADDKLWVALRTYFEPPILDPPKAAIPGKLPVRPSVTESMQATFTAAMKAADRLDVTFRGVTIKYPAGGDGIRNVHLSNLKLAGEVNYNAKKPENPVEIVFVNKETRIPIYLVGDTAYWGDKQWKSVKLTRDSMWKQMVGTVPTPENAGLKPDPDDASGLAAAIESADSIEATRVGGETEILKGSLTLKKEDLKGLSKFALGLGKPVSYYGKDEPDAIDIVVKKGKDSQKYRLIGDTLVFDKDQSVKLEHKLIWMLIIYKLQKTDK